MRGKGFAVLVMLILLFLAGCREREISVMCDAYEGWGGRIGDIKSVAVPGFWGKDGVCNDEITSSMVRHLRMSGYLTVVDNENVCRIVDEKGFDLVKALQSGEEAKIAELLNVDALIYGTIDASFITVVRHKEPPTPAFLWGYGCRPSIYYLTVQPIPYLHREGKVTINVHMFDAKLQRDLGGPLDFSRTYNRDFDQFYYRGIKPDGRYWFDSQKTQPMLADEDMIVQMADRIFDSITEAFLPSYVMKIRTLQDDDRGGGPLAREGKWKAARTAWERDSASCRDWKILTNLGICSEREGDSAGALSWYEKARELNPGSDELSHYASAVKEVVKARKLAAPLDLPPGALKYRVAEVKQDGRIYINAGREEGIQAGDRFIIARYQMEFDRELMNSMGGYYYPLCTVVVEKVFDGVSQGRLIQAPNALLPHNGDPAAKITGE